MLMALLLAGLSPALAQDNDSTKKESEMTKRDTTEISWRKKTFVIISDDDGFGMGQYILDTISHQFGNVGNVIKNVITVGTDQAS